MPDLDRTPAAVARRFVDRINEHDVAGLLALMTEDHRFVDAADQMVSGRDAMRKAWETYFSWFSDYRIEVVDIVAADSAAAGVVALFGYASGSFSGAGADPQHAAWRLSAAWKAVVRVGRLVEWRVYCDPAPMLRSMGAGRAEKK